MRQVLALDILENFLDQFSTERIATDTSPCKNFRYRDKKLEGDVGLLLFLGQRLIKNFAAARDGLTPQHQVRAFIHIMHTLFKVEYEIYE